MYFFVFEQALMKGWMDGLSYCLEKMYADSDACPETLQPTGLQFLM